MVVDCPLVITSKVKLFFRPDKTRKKEWMVQPVFCIVDAGSCLTSIVVCCKLKRKMGQLLWKLRNYNFSRRTWHNLSLRSFGEKLSLLMVPSQRALIYSPSTFASRKKLQRTFVTFPINIVVTKMESVVARCLLFLQNSFPWSSDHTNGHSCALTFSNSTSAPLCQKFDWISPFGDKTSELPSYP